MEEKRMNKIREAKEVIIDKISDILHLGGHIVAGIDNLQRFKFIVKGDEEGQYNLILVDTEEDEYYTIKFYSPV